MVTERDKLQVEFFKVDCNAFSGLSVTNARVGGGGKQSGQDGVVSEATA